MIELDSENIRHIKLSSGEEVVCYVSTDLDSKMLHVHSPMRVTTTMNERGFSFFFVQWQPLAKGESCLINPLHIISTVEIANDIKEKYVRLIIQLREQGKEDGVEDDCLHADSFMNDDEYYDDEFDEFTEYELEPLTKSTTIH
jgi:hypothetical protein